MYYLRLVGEGAGGGGGADGGIGGGAGGWFDVYLNVTPGQIFNIQIGSPGAGGAAYDGGSTNYGQTGGNTIVNFNGVTYYGFSGIGGNDVYRSWGGRGPNAGATGKGGQGYSGNGADGGQPIRNSDGTIVGGSGGVSYFTLAGFGGQAAAGGDPYARPRGPDYSGFGANGTFGGGGGGGAIDDRWGRYWGWGGSGGSGWVKIMF